MSGDFFKLRGRTKCSVASIICELLEEAKAAYTLGCMQPSLSLLATYFVGWSYYPTRGRRTLTKPLEELPDVLRCSLHEGRLKDELLIGLFVLPQLLHSVVELLFLPFLEA